MTEVKERDPLTERIIACAYKVHNELGPGFSEKVYHNALKLALGADHLSFETEKSFEVYFQEQHVGTLRLDLVIEDKIVTEVKAVTGALPVVFEYQVLSYLKASKYSTGLLINFGNKSCQVRRLMS